MDAAPHIERAGGMMKARLRGTLLLVGMILFSGAGVWEIAARLGATVSH